MRKIITSAAFLLAITSYSYSQSCPTNADWELGNKTNWTCKYGGYGVGTTPNFTTFYSTNSCLPAANTLNLAANSAANRHALMGPGAGNDPNSVNPLVPRVAPAALFPSGTNVYSFRVGNDATGGYNYVGPPNPPANANYAQAEAVSTTFTVTAQNAGFTYLFAVFVQDPGHAVHEQPRFEIVLKDQTGTITPCGYYKVVGGDSLANTFYMGPNNYQYTNWAKVGLDLTGYIGQQVTLEFRTSDCFPPGGVGGGSTSITCISNVCTTTTCSSGCCTTCYNNGNPCTTTGCGGPPVTNSPGTHSAYAYVDAYCGPLEIYQPLFCNPATSVQLCAPPGYIGYTWPNQSGTGGVKYTQCVTVTNPVPGTTYTVQLKSVTNCGSAAYVTLKSLTVAVNDTTICAGSSTPFRLVATPDLPGSYTYSWTPSTGLSCTTCANPLLSVIPGSTKTYSVSVYHQTALCSVNKVLTIRVNNISAPPNITSNVNCFGGNNGGVSVNPSGGTPNYTYSWLPGNQTTSSLTNLSSGTYTLTVRDAIGCSNRQSISITQPSAALNGTPTATSNVNCFGGNNGIATSTPSGGTPNYTYSWLPGNQTTSGISNLSSGTYTVTVTDSKGCTNRQTVTLTQPSAALTTTASATTHVSCFGNNTGSATANPSGGTTNYTYSWSAGGQTTQIATGLTSGTYTVKVTDAKGCTANQTVSITQPSATLATGVKAAMNVNCFSGNTGIATSTPSGGTPNYTYSWLPGNQTTSGISGLSAGSYTVTVTDSKGCTNRQTITLTQPSAALTSTVTAGGSVSCFGGNNGNALANPSGGTPNYTYFWLPGGQSTSSISGLSAGNYTVTINDAKGCTNRQTVAITQPPGSLAVTAGASPNVSCFGGTNGSAVVTPTGGTPNYTYAWLPGGQTTATISGLSAGNYSVTVTDAQGCSNQQAVAITQPTAALTATVTPTSDVSCFAGSNGSATVIPAGGTSAYTYAWLPGGETTSSITGLNSGTYTVNITDAQGCTALQTVFISQPNAALTATLTATTNVSCFGGTNGVATATPAGGTAAYTYAWLPGGETTSSISNLASGTYTVAITDAQGCTHNQSVTISQPTAALTATVTATSNVNCFGGNNGSALATPTGGTAAYTYAWLPGGQTSSSISNLAMGTYTVTIRDAQGCTNRQTVSISQPNAALTATVTATSNVNCFGGNNGSASATPTGGTAAYTYAWLPGGQTSSSISNLAMGTYTVTIRDAQGCTNRQTVSISQPNAALTATVTATSNVNCLGGSNGSASVTPTGGTAAYTYAWLPGGQTTPGITNLTAGTYTVLVSDSKGCTYAQTVTLSEPPTGVNATSTSTPAACTKDDGTITITPTGGVPNYTYQWSPNVSTSNFASNLPAGTWTVTVTDQNGCTRIITATVNQPPNAIAMFTFNPATGLAPLSINFSNGSTGTRYQWNYGDTTKTVIQDTVFNPKHLYKDTGTYIIRLITFNNFGCADTMYATIRVNMKSVLCIPNVFSPNGDGKNDLWKLCQPGIENLEVAVYDRWGLLIYQWDTPAGGWDGRTTSGKEVPEGTYYYVIKARGTDDVDYGTTAGFLMLLRK